MATDKVLCCIVALFLCLSQLVVGVFANTNYCTTCRHGCTEHGQQRTPESVSVHADCPETQRNCCALTPCCIVQVENVPFLVTAPEHPKPVGMLGILTEHLVAIRLSEEYGSWPHIEAKARSAPLYLQNLSLLC